MASGAPDVSLRAGTGAGLFRAWPFRRDVGNAVRRGEYQPVAVLRDGEPASPRGAVDARRAAGADAELDFGASEHGGDSGARVRRVYDGSGVGSGGGTVF